jgi:hypothetical protein
LVEKLPLVMIFAVELRAPERVVTPETFRLLMLAVVIVPVVRGPRVVDVIGGTPVNDE